MGIAPGAEQTQGVAGGQGDAPRFQPATLAGKVGEFDHAMSVGGQDKAGRRLLREGKFEYAPFVRTRVIYVQAEAGCSTDKDGITERTGSEWEYTFTEQNGITKVTISIYNESLERLERILNGFTIGMKMSLVNLEELLASLSK